MVGFVDLPQEVVLDIFSHITTPQELCCLAQVSKVFNTVSSDDKLWRPICGKEWFASSGQWKKSYIDWIRKAATAYKNRRQHVLSTLKPTQSSGADYDLLLKMLLIGDAGVGKSSLLLRFADNTFTESFISTIGVDFKIATRQIADLKVKAQIWDTAGQERFRTITSSYYRGARGFLLVFDLSDKHSFESLTRWANEIERYASEDHSTILIGHKIDLNSERRVDRSEAEKFAFERGMDYLEASAKTGENVEQAFEMLMSTIVLGGAFGTGVPGPRPHYIPPMEVLEYLGVISRKVEDKNTQSTTEKKKGKERCSLQ